MLMPWNSRKKEKESANAHEILFENGNETTIINDSIPAFFLTRAIGWFAMALVIFGGTTVWVNSASIGSGNLLAGAAVVGAICVFNGIRILRVGKRKSYFIIRLTCADIRNSGIIENMSSYLNPASNSAFRNSQQVTFTTNSGTKVIFTYERSRKFLIGARYDFYFNKPAQGDKITAEMLERLRIDHSIVRDELTSEDVTGDISVGDTSRK